MYVGFLFVCFSEVENSSKEANHHPKTTPLFSLFKFNLGLFCFLEFPTWKKKKGTPLHRLTRVAQSMQYKP